MRFMITREGAARLGVNPDRVEGLEFDGPSVREGLLGGFPRGVLGYAKKLLKVDRVEMFDVGESRLLYYFLTIRTADHRLLPFTKFDDAAVADFQLVKHEVTSRDQDGDCGECNMPVELTSVHFTPEEIETRLGLPAGTLDPAEVPPTEGPASQATTATATPSQPSTGLSSSPSTD